LDQNQAKGKQMQTAEAQNELYCGADLHGNNVFLTLCDGTGQRVMERRVKANLAAVNTALKPYGDRVKQVAVESTYNWYWFVDGLRSQGRDALRRRMLIVGQRTQSLLSLESLFARHGLACPGADELKQWTEVEGEALSLDRFTRLQVESLLGVLRQQDQVARRIEETVRQAVKPKAEYTRIQQVPGIGPVPGLVVVLESGEFGRFASAGDYASYCRTVKSERRSNGKKKGENNRKNGNPYLGWAFAEAAVYAIGFYPRMAAWYERKKRRRNVPVAMKALACKLAKAAWHVMRGREFDEALLFG
jgi:transposase